MMNFDETIARLIAIGSFVPTNDSMHKAYYNLKWYNHWYKYRKCDTIIRKKMLKYYYTSFTRTIEMIKIKNTECDKVSLESLLSKLIDAIEGVKLMKIYYDDNHHVKASILAFLNTIDIEFDKLKLIDNMQKIVNIKPDCDVVSLSDTSSIESC